MQISTLFQKQCVRTQSQNSSRKPQLIGQRCKRMMLSQLPEWVETEGEKYPEMTVTYEGTPNPHIIFPHTLE